MYSKNMLKTFKNLRLQNHWANFNQKWYVKHPWVKGIHLCSNERPLSRERYNKQAQRENTLKSLNVLLQSHRAILSILGTKHPWVGEIKFFK